MWPFKKKTKWNLEEFCQQYFDKYFLEKEPVAASVANMTNSYNKIISEKLLEVDPAFNSVDFNSFSTELLIIRFELFSLAWYHEFQEESAIMQTVFSKKYLTQNNKDYVWEGAEVYNNAISKSAFHGLDSSTAVARAKITFTNSMRVQLFEKYTKQGLEAKCVARTLNKLGSDKRWKNLEVTLKYIGIELCKKLNYEKMNKDAMFILISVLKGLYDGSMENIEEIKISS